MYFLALLLRIIRILTLIAFQLVEILFPFLSAEIKEPVVSYFSDCLLSFFKTQNHSQYIFM